MNEFPLMLLIILTIVLFVLIVFAFAGTDIPHIICGFVSVILSFTLSQISLNGLLVEQFGGITTEDTIATGTVIVQSAAQANIYMFIFIVMTMVTLKQIITQIQMVNESKNVEVE